MISGHIDEKISNILRASSMVKNIRPVLQGHLVPDIVIDELLRSPSKVPVYWLAKIAEILGVQEQMALVLVDVQELAKAQRQNISSTKQSS